MKKQKTRKSRPKATNINWVQEGVYDRYCYRHNKAFSRHGKCARCDFERIRKEIKDRTRSGY